MPEVSEAELTLVFHGLVSEVSQLFALHDKGSSAVKAPHQCMLTQ